MFNPLDYVIARQAVKQLAEEQLAVNAQPEPPKARRLSLLLANLWSRRPRLQAKAEARTAAQQSERFA